MANANSTSSRTSKRSAGQGASQDHGGGPEPRRIVLDTACLRRFDSDRMGQHNHLLGLAGDLLSDAYDVAACTAVLGRILRASQIGRSAGCKDGLNESEEDNILRGIIAMNDLLNSRLCGSAEAFDDRMTDIEKEAAQ